MPLTLAQVEHIAELAKLQLTPDEKERFREQLSRVLDDAARLETLDTSDIPPTATVLPLRGALRADEVVTPPARETVLANAPARTAEFFQVQMVFDDEGRGA
jgi:aspartyl-tRNA(Asn)/glutamyl-tRNA(Gln) amidotransferase subunit C